MGDLATPPIEIASSYAGSSDDLVTGLASAIVEDREDRWDASQLDKPHLRSSSYATLILLKPELFERSFLPDVERALSIAISVLRENGVAIVRAAVIPGVVLKHGCLVERIYFTLDRIARRGISACAPSVVRTLRELGVEGHSVSAFEYLAHRKDLDAEELESRVRAVETTKLGHNAYLTYLDEETSPVLNAFWPGLLAHLARPKGVMVGFYCVTDLAPTRLLREVIGVGEPRDAEVASLRRRFLDIHRHTGRAPLSLGRNGVHGSPGIVEGACAVDVVFPEAHALKGLLRKVGQDEGLADIARWNPLVYEGSRAPKTLFEITEGQPFDDAVLRLRADILGA